MKLNTHHQTKTMQAKLLVMLMTICGLIILVVSYLAVMTMNQQRGMAKIQAEALAQTRLDTMENLIFSLLAQKKQAIQLRLERQGLTDVELNTWLETDSNINQIFVMKLNTDTKLDDTLIHQNQIQFPKLQDDNLDRQSQIWLEIIAPIIEDPTRLFQATAKEGEVPPTEGWYASNYGGQPVLVYWIIQSEHTASKSFNASQDAETTANSHKILIGVKLSYTKFIADLLSSIEINYSPDSLEIIQSGRTLFHSIPLIPANQTQASQQFDIYTNVLPFPLHDWQINYKMAKTAELGIFWLVVLIVGLISMLVLGLTFIVFRDLTRQHKEASLRVNFVGQVSHELKTPLTNIALYAQMQKEQLDELDAMLESEIALPESLHRYNEVILHESQRLTRLIQNVLDFTQAPKVRLKTVNAKAIIDKLSDLFLPVLALKDIKLSITCDDSIEFLTDADKVIQILCNLLSNVEKYASCGKRVDLTVTQSDTQVIFEVRDYGPGVDELSLARLYEPFYRVNSNITEGVSGTGIGLTIAKQLAESLSGDIKAVLKAPGLAVILILSKQG